LISAAQRIKRITENYRLPQQSESNAKKIIDFRRTANQTHYRKLSIAAAINIDETHTNEHTTHSAHRMTSLCRQTEH